MHYMACNKYFLILHLCTILHYKNFIFLYSWALENYMPKWPVYHEQILTSIQNMIDYDLGTSIRQIWSLLGNIDLLVRKIVKEDMGYKSYIIIRRQFNSNAMKQKRMGYMEHMKHVLVTNLWLLRYPDLNYLDYFVTYILAKYFSCIFLIHIIAIYSSYLILDTYLSYMF